MPLWKKECYIYTHLKKVRFIDAYEFLEFFQNITKTTNARDFKKGLNLHRLSTVLFLTYLRPNNSNIIKARANWCGASILMAKLLKLMNKNQNLLKN